MSLQPGQTLSHYRIVEKIGEGGMGEVYLAEDTRLKRQVALKVLPRELSSDAERRSRFEREAQAVAALNHPNIVTIFSVEEVEQVPFLTMERVSGRPLSTMLGAALPMERIFQLAIPLADAVGAAHQQGITHRDLKPDNVMVDQEGRIKVLDFGLAKLREPAGTDSVDSTSLPTATITAEGRILGTAAYMSPEQAEGKAIQASSDNFSLGIILYEMATGKRPFSGDTPISTISAILSREPEPLLEINPALPRQLDRIIRRCLIKDPSRRYSTAWELRNELELLQQEVEAGTAPVGPVANLVDGRSPHHLPGASSGAWRAWLPAAAVGILALAVGTGLGSLLNRPDEGSTSAAPLPRQLNSMHFAQMTFDAGVETFPALAPDGDFVLYSARENDIWNIYMMRVGGSRAINLTEEIAQDCTHPAYSPDGQFIAFRSSAQGGGIFVMGSTGESKRRLVDFGHNPSWSPDGKEIAFSDEQIDEPNSRNSKSALWMVNVATGQQREIFSGDAVQPSWSPDGRRIAFWTYHPGEERSGQRDIHTIRVDGTDEKPVTADSALDWNPVWSHDGRYLYFASDRDGSMNIWRLPVDQASGEVQGDPQRVATPAIFSGPFALSARNDRIAYSSVTRQMNLAEFSLDPDNGWKLGPAQLLTGGSLKAQHPTPSADGEWIAFTTGGTQEDLCLIRRDGSGFRKLTDDPDKDRGPTFIPGTEKIAFYSTRSGKYEIWTINMDGSGLQQLTDLPSFDPYWPTFSPDGKYMSTYGPRGTFIFEMNKDLFAEDDAIVPTTPDDRPVLLSSWSPDGTQLVGTFLDGWTGEWVIYDLPTDQVKIVKDAQTAGTSNYRWHPDGHHVLRGAGRAGVRLYSLPGGDSSTLASSVPFNNPFRISSDGRSIFSYQTRIEADIWMASETE